ALGEIALNNLCAGITIVIRIRMEGAVSYAVDIKFLAASPQKLASCADAGKGGGRLAGRGKCWYCYCGRGQLRQVLTSAPAGRPSRLPLCVSRPIQLLPDHSKMP